MSEQVLSTAAVLLILAGAAVYSYVGKMHMKKRQIGEKFGKIPEIGELDKKVSHYYEWRRDRESCDWVDDITWNDLSMDQIFQRINACDTSAGEEILYWRLRKNSTDREENTALEERISLFSEDEKERKAVQKLLGRAGKNASSYYIPLYMESIEENRIGYQWGFRILQILLAASLFLPVIFGDSRLGFSFLGIASANLLLYIVLKMKYEIQMGMAGSAVSLLECARELSGKKNIQRLFPELKKKTECFGSVLRKSRLLQLNKVAFNSGDLSAVILDYLLGITLCRITTYNRMIAGMSDKSEEYMEIYRQLGELDAAVSIASFRASLPYYCQPEFTGDSGICMQEVYHPLVKNPVGNTVDLKRSCLITGSNASGKSTFIKAVTVNAILAQSICTCAAKYFSMPYVKVLTSMAVKDDLLAGESYFIREIRYLRRILDELEEDKMMLCAIDEILRGTNTGERLRASRAILEYLKNKNCIALVATHDRELTDLLKEDYDNFHFSEEIGESDIRFTYRILPGPSASHNAIKLLEFAGFPREIIEASKKETAAG